ncbi:ABC transporter substrate-binding protein [Paracoccus suum]|uniref:ABC transporter substrate-binding protein n=2 Tax=Paracoccus suum TaxID=2259340 RepID=A0A344PNV3_9RHOB|nr:ABC transporter substrate-binding protein [Paracoccus suum]
MALAQVAAPAAAPAEVQTGGTLVVASLQKPRHLNPAVQSGIATAVPGAQIFATPLRFGADFTPQPYLAESWSFSEDQKVLTLKLRQGAVFHDGQPITAEDVKYSMDVVKANHPFNSMLAPVSSVEATDPQTVTITMSQPHPAILLALSSALMPVLPKHVFDDGTDIKASSHNNLPVGSGPFRVTEFEPGQHIMLEKFDKFFLPGKPYLDRIVIKQYKDANSAGLALEAGEVQLYPYLDSTRLVQRLEKKSNMTVTDQGYAGIGAMNWLAFNTKHPALSDVRVRQAISYALDRNFVTKALHGGLSKPAYEPVVSSSPFYTDAVEKYDFDLDKAKALLAEAGYGEGGKPLALSIDYLPENEEQQHAVAEYVKAQLAKVGIKVSVRASPDFPTWAQRVSNHDFDMTMDQVFNWGDPVIGVNRTYVCDNIKPGVVWSNTQSYCNPEVDKLLASAAVEPDLAKRKEQYAQAFAQITRVAPIYFVNEAPYFTAYSDVVQNPPVSIWGPMGPMDEVWLKK